MASAANLTAPDSIKDMWNTFFTTTYPIEEPHGSNQVMESQGVLNIAILHVAFRLLFWLGLTQPEEFISMSSFVFKHAGLALINSAESLPGCG